MKRHILFSLLAGLAAAKADPLQTSWLTSTSGKYARIYTSTANRTSGASVTTWSGTISQSTPAYAGVNEVNYSPSWVYIRTSGLGAHVMGPWTNPNLPKNQALVWRFPRSAAGAVTVAGQSTLTGMGQIGFTIDGVAVYNTSDGYSYSNADGADKAPPSTTFGDGIWNRDAFPNEALSFDYALAHNQPSGEYHYHVNPIATRYLLGDNVNYDSSTKNYSENTSATTFKHSPILGWMNDGLPLYGPYGYDGGSTGATATTALSGNAVSAVNVITGGSLYQSTPQVTFSGGGGSGATATAVISGGVVTGITLTTGGSGYTSAPTVVIGGVRRMVSGYQFRDGSNNTTNLTTTGRTTYPAWAALAKGSSATLTPTQYGPAVNTSYPLGHFVEDYDYLGDLGYTQSSRSNSGGVFFDLNKYNVRFCVTPDFPNGTWAYFTATKVDGTSFYPYNVGRWYYGNPTGGSSTATAMNADTPLTNQFLGGANTALKIKTPDVSNGTVTLTWSSVEGGTYAVDASANQSSWTSKATGIVATDTSKSSSYTALGSSGTEYGRVSRTALATYDATGQTASTVAQSAIASYSASSTPSTAPSITSIATTPASPASTDIVTVAANVTPVSGGTVSQVQLTYDIGASSTNTVFSETMAAAAATNWTGTNANNPWTIAFVGPPASPFSQTTTANHTASGQGNLFGMEITSNAPSLANSTMTTANPINATGTSGYVEFYIRTTGLAATQGWDFQTSTDSNTWTTRLSELNATNQAFTLKSYTLSAAERVSTLKLRFRFQGAGQSTTPVVRLDDIKVVTTTASSPVTVAMLDNGLNGDGTAGDGVYGASIPAQISGTTVSYTIAATDNSQATSTSGNNSYTVSAAAPVLTVTPSTSLTFSGPAGGAFSPANVSYTLTNSGNAAMTWTAGKTASWLTLSATSGTLAVGTTTNVSATVNSNANSLSAGSYSDTITFTNNTNGVGNATRAASLTVNSNSAPAAPVLASLSAFTAGASKTISWSAVPGATSYTLKISSNADFATVLSSQVVTSPTASFSALTNGATYYYRVIATNNIGDSVDSNIVSSTQDATVPAVAITSPATSTTTATNSITISGTSSDAISGISSVTLNGVTATTTNGFATWSLSVPLGFGTNGITAVATDGAGNVTTTSPVRVTLTATQTYNPLIIPEVITGTTFDLNLHVTNKQFLSGAATNTYAYNNMLFWGPTLIMNKGDWVQMNVTNNLADTTTTHWHGFHIPAIMDGGPHQTIPAGSTWRPSFKVDNNAGTYWYHPHLHEFTQTQLTYGAGGMIIIRDPEEAALNLPRTYGVDDIPLALTSRRFSSNQFVGVGSEYGDSMVVNGVLNPQVSLPKQYVRLRVLNAEMERSYNLGITTSTGTDRTFYVISTDGGLVSAPIAVTRVALAVGERAEILVDLTGDTVGTSFDLKAYNSGQANDFPGGEPASSGQFGSALNNTTFNLLHVNVAAATANPVTTRPTTLKTQTFWTDADVTNSRTVTITGGFPNSATPLFSFDNTSFSPNVFNQNLNLNAVEKWTITNSSGFSHSFHIHDIQFNLTSRTGGNNSGLKTYEQGWKDTLYVGQNQSVSFIAKFDGFASNTNPFMYHCHFSSHEDAGLMGQFLVKNNAVEDLAIASFTRSGTNSEVSLQFKSTVGTTYALQYSPDMTTDSWKDIGSVTSDGASANFTETDAARLSQARGFYRVTIPAIP